jgi:hypothetical protein
MNRKNSDVYGVVYENSLHMEIKSTFILMLPLTLQSYVAQVGTCNRALVKCTVLSVFTLRLTLSRKNGEVRPNHL